MKKLFVTLLLGMLTAMSTYALTLNDAAPNIKDTPGCGCKTCREIRKQNEKAKPAPKKAEPKKAAPAPQQQKKPAATKKPEPRR